MSASFVPEALHAALAERLRNLYAAHFGAVLLGPDHLEQMVRDSLDPERSMQQLALFRRMTGAELAGLRVLEIGSGVGMTVATARARFGAEAHGIEPAADEYAGTFGVSRDLLAGCGLDPGAVRTGVGESLPYPDGAFDAVISSNVLEHVQDPARVLAECLRVVRPGGWVHIVVPNYGSWWEGHYGVLWLPHMGHRLARLYLRLLGRDPSYLDTLVFVTRGRLERWLAPHAANIAILDWGVGLWEERVREAAFAEYGALSRLKGLVRIVHSLRLVPLLLAVGRRLHWETPIALTLRRLR